MGEIFHELEERGIRYLHFKSNTNLEDSFSGRGDFDVLVEKSRIADTEAVIAGHNGKRFNPPRLGRYPGVDNWLIYDEETGVIHHIHLHFQLATGKPLVKDYIIPWEDILFESRIKDNEYDIYITDPNLELLLLLVRMVVKSGIRDNLKALIGTYKMNPYMREEFYDLRKKSDPDMFRHFGRDCGFDNDDIRIFMDALSCERIDSALFKSITRTVRRKFLLCRRMSGMKAMVLSSYYVLRRRISRMIKNHTDNCFMIKKVHDTSGLIVAFVGIDGAGKSTVAKDIYKWLNNKIECKRFYMGRGEGRIPLSMKVLNAHKQKEAVAKTGTASQTRSIQKISMFGNPIKFVRRMLRMKALLDVEINNNKKIRIMNRYRLNGGISIMDRYPQIELVGKNDGPKIVEYRETFENKGLIDRFIRREAKALSIVRKVKPDVVFRLNISAETSMHRKPEQDNIDEFRKKADDLKNITFQEARIIEIDAQQPYDQELLSIKSVLWSLI